jgi:hypothetical protein
MRLGGQDVAKKPRSLDAVTPTASKRPYTTISSPRPAEMLYLRSQKGYWTGAVTYLIQEDWILLQVEIICGVECLPETKGTSQHKPHKYTPVFKGGRE